VQKIKVMIKLSVLNLGLGIVLFGLGSFISFNVQAQNKGIKSANKTNVPQKEVDVYIAGASYNPTTLKHVAKYWKNGVPVQLTDGQNDATATAIAIDGNDVHVAGFDNGVVAYWKNGERIPLTSGGGRWSRAYSIAVFKGDVYIAGYERVYDHGQNSNWTDWAKYWKNGQPVSLSDGRSHAGASSIAIHQSGDVLVAGSYNGKVAYWRNGQLVDAINSTLYTASAITTVNNDVYIAGITSIPGKEGKQAAYWKGNEGTTILTNVENDAVASSIAVDKNGNVYVAGHINYKPTYWKNGIPTTLEGLSSGFPDPYSIAFEGSDVYIAGLGKAGGQYWKNGETVLIPRDKDGTPAANAITVIKRNSNGAKTAKTGVIVKTNAVPASSPPAPISPIVKDANAIAEEEAIRFFADNKKKPGIITTASGLQYQVISTGAGPRPTATDNVKIQHKRTLLEGNKVIDANANGQPPAMLVKNLLPGMAEGIQLMNVGSKFKLFIPPGLAYGSRGKSSYILIFELELLEIIK